MSRYGEFANEAQMKACWAQWRRDVQAGYEPGWKCKQWYAGQHKSTKRRSQRKWDRLDRKLRTGPRGGKYYLYGGRRNYVTTSRISTTAIKVGPRGGKYVIRNGTKRYL